MPSVNIDLRSIPAPKDGVRAEIKFTPALIGKVAGCLVLLTMGLYYLYSGREQQSVSRMLLGAVLIIGAFVVFF
ncbi:MAG: hypothetical protein HY924_04415 [Elusimicrobia bacterium]|nr:hypothetical protein [Elusimicrobiota bacterium]